MTRTFASAALTLCFLLSAPIADAADFLFEAQPASLVFHKGERRVRASNAQGGLSEEFFFNASWFPSARIGASVDRGRYYADFTVGGGLLGTLGFWNELVSPLLRADAAAHFKLGNHLNVGPHLGAVYFVNPTWHGTSDLEFSSAPGLLGGLDLSAGKRKIAFFASVDYLWASLPVEGRNGWVVEDDRLDLSGVAVQLGISGAY